MTKMIKDSALRFYPDVELLKNLTSEDKKPGWYPLEYIRRNTNITKNQDIYGDIDKFLADRDIENLNPNEMTNLCVNYYDKLTPVLKQWLNHKGIETTFEMVYTEYLDLLMGKRAEFMKRFERDSSDLSHLNAFNVVAILENSKGQIRVADNNHDRQIYGEIYVTKSKWVMENIRGSYRKANINKYINIQNLLKLTDELITALNEDTKSCQH